MDARAIVIFAIFLGLAVLSILYYIGANYETAIEGIETTSTTVSTTTTTTLPYAGSVSIADTKASNASAENVAWLERRTFDLVNGERTARNLTALKWNDAVASVARAHSADMAANGFFSHTGSGGTNVSSRLQSGGVWYWNSSAENLLMEGGAVYYTNILGIIEWRTKYFTFEQLAQNATQGWMNSTGHRENILNPMLDEAGVGVHAFNDSYYFTQDFIVRVGCGYNGGPCCHEAGYMPWCYVPLACTSRSSGGTCG
jgi:uncharacterized protein YkwD